MSIEEWQEEKKAEEEKKPQVPTVIDPVVPSADSYDPQSIQSQGAPPPGPSYATPTEQAAAQGGGVPQQINPYFESFGQGMQYMYGQYPYNVGGVGTPTELRYGQTDIKGQPAGYGPSSYQWSESPGSLAELAQGRTPPGPALRAADTVGSFLMNFGVRPGFVTPFVTQSLGLTPGNMVDMGYVQDLYGQWIALDFGDEQLTGGVGGYGGGYGGGYSGYGSYSSPSGMRSGYTSSFGLVNWRIS